jgi:protein-disulfide isomerase
MAAPQTMKTRRQRRVDARATRRLAPRRATRSPHGRIGIGTLSLIGLLGGVAVVVLAIWLGAAPKVAPTAVAVVRAPVGIPAEGFILGHADAAVTIDLYEDFQCPACQSWGTSVFPRLVANELADGTAKVIFHNLAFIGPESTAAAHAGFAARQQGRFWDMWATMYGNQGRENAGAFSRARLVEMARGIELDLAQFEADMDSAAAATALSASIAEADAASVSSTPTLVIAGRAYTGVQSYSDISVAVAAAAAAAATP